MKNSFSKTTCSLSLRLLSFSLLISFFSHRVFFVSFNILSPLYSLSTSLSTSLSFSLSNFSHFQILTPSLSLLPVLIPVQHHDSLVVEIILYYFNTQFGNLQNLHRLLTELLTNERNLVITRSTFFPILTKFFYKKLHFVS